MHAPYAFHNKLKKKKLSIVRKATLNYRSQQATFIISYFKLVQFISNI